MITSNTTQLSTRRLRAPREDRGVVVDPPWNAIAHALSENIEVRTGWEYDFQGKSSRRLIAEARAELCAAASGWWNAYGGGRRQPFDAGEPILLAGHQPRMFHPGVWLKNFALGRLAEKHAATAINLIIDSDAAANAAILLPGGSVASPVRESVAYDLPEPVEPYEERRIEDRAVFESFAKRAGEKISSFVQNPLLEKYWPLAVARSRAQGLLGASLAQARHLLEDSWGNSTWEIPQSAVCDQPAFLRFTAHLLAQMPRFLPVYNAAVDEYRQIYRIRNHAHPAPDLAVEGDWRETPFWIWTAENPHRRRLFACPSGGETALSDRQEIELKLSVTPDADAGRAVEQLAEWRRKGVKIRSRALITTLWARLVLGDLFIHGIGGGNYDHVTDAIIERFFGCAPPHFVVLSATLLLPIERRETGGRSRRIRREAARFDLSSRKVPRQFAEHMGRRFRFGVGAGCREVPLDRNAADPRERQAALPRHTPRQRALATLACRSAAAIPGRA